MDFKREAPLLKFLYQSYYFLFERVKIDGFLAEYSALKMHKKLPGQFGQGQQWEISSK